MNHSENKQMGDDHKTTADCDDILPPTPQQILEVRNLSPSDGGPHNQQTHRQ
jgi:hypothetical protein